MKVLTLKRRFRKMQLKCGLLAMITLCGLTGCMSAGTLGAVADRDLDCPEHAVRHELAQLLQLQSFKVAAADSTVVSWWNESGYDFLDYDCINLRQHLYMLTLDADDMATSSISIRARYSRKKQEWVFATEFSASEEEQAESAMDQLVNQLGCN